MSRRTEVSNERREELREKIKEFPQLPGVYLMKNEAEKIIYVGKAKNLRTRVRSYFSDSQDHSPKTKFLVRQIYSIDTILTRTEVEAFLLEASLIKKYRPRYNIRLKDDKAYPYIRVSMTDEFPRLYLARKVKKDGSLYFGPYLSGQAVWGTIRFLNHTFQLRDCKDAFMASRKRPCLTHQIGRCTAPCVNLVTAPEYSEDIKQAVQFLRGRDQQTLKELRRRMKVASEDERFEAAARVRDSIQAIEKILERQSVVNDTSELDQDVLGFAGDERGTLIETVHIRAGRVIGTRGHFLPLLDPQSADEDAREWLVSFINQYYDEEFIPDEVWLPVDLGRDLMALLEDLLAERSGGQKVRVKFPTTPVGHRLLELAQQNAQKHFDEHVSKSRDKEAALDEIQERLKLPQRPVRIECFDISNFQGAETVASQVVFEDGVPNKDQYRRYKLRSVDGVNDFASMREVLSRRLAHQEWEDPHLIVVDGGKGQLAVAVEVLKELGRNDLPVVGLAKARTQGDFQSSEVRATEERFFLPGRQNPVVFRTGSEAFRILVSLRDEAHRFAIQFHRKLREASSIESELDAVPRLGPQRKKSLLTRYKSVDEIRAADVDELVALPGFNRPSAEALLEFLRDVRPSDSSEEEASDSGPEMGRGEESI